MITTFQSIETFFYIKRVIALSADPDYKPIPIPPEWGRPVAEHLRALAEIAENGSPADVEKALDIPELLSKMDINALAGVFETAMAQAIIAGANKSLAKIKQLKAFSVGVEFAPLWEAVAKLDRKTPIGSKLNSEEWAEVPLALRERAQFSAKVESIKFLATVQDELRKTLALEKDEFGRFRSRSIFIDNLQQIAIGEGLNTTTGAGLGTVRDIRSAKRLGLIYDMQTNQAQEFSRWKMDQDPDILDAFPAQRFVRIESRLHPRGDWEERWQSAGNATGWDGASQNEMAALKSSPIWAELSEFGTPWPPFDYGSGMGLMDIDRAEAESLGLLDPDEPVEPMVEDFNSELSASIENIPPEMSALLKDSFGDQVAISGGKVSWQGNLIGDLVDKIVDYGIDRPFDNKVFKGQSIDFGTVTSRAQELAAQAGKELASKAKMKLMPDNIYHIIKQHGEGRETRGDQLPVTKLDLELLPHVWREPDVIEQDRGAIRFEKRISGKDVVVLWEIRGHDIFFPISFRIKK